MIMHFIIYENSHFEIHIHPQKIENVRCAYIHGENLKNERKEVFFLIMNKMSIASHFYVVEKMAFP